MKSDTQKLREHLASGKSITPLEALNKFGMLRLGARIYELRKSWAISTEMVESNGKVFARYRAMNITFTT